MPDPNYLNNKKWLVHWSNAHNVPPEARNDIAAAIEMMDALAKRVQDLEEEVSLLEEELAMYEDDFEAALKEADDGD